MCPKWLRGVQGRLEVAKVCPGWIVFTLDDSKVNEVSPRFLRYT
jgi:hypothetical protein